MSARRTITQQCQVDGCGARITHSLSADTFGPVICPFCRATAHASVGPVIAGWQVDGRVQTCPCCGSRELFIRKDFPQKLGLLIVVIAAVVSTILLSRHTVAALSVLAGVVLIDAIIYLMVGRVTVCYRCRAELRGFAPNPDHEWFDLATAEKYPTRIESRQ